VARVGDREVLVTRWGGGVKGLPSRAGGQCPRARYRWQHKRERNPSAIFLLPIVSPPPPVSLAVCRLYNTPVAAEEEEKEKEEKKYRRRRRRNDNIITYYNNVTSKGIIL